MGRQSARIKKRNKSIIYGALGLTAVLFLVYFVAFSPFSPITTTPATTNASTFQLISYIDGEDVSDFVEVSIWIPDDNADFEDPDDVYTWSEFEEEESSKDAEDISIDLSAYKYVWLEIDPDGEQVFQNQHHLITPAGRNANYKYYVHQLSSDVNFMCLDNTSSTAWFNFTLPVRSGTLAANFNELQAEQTIPYGFDQIFNATIQTAGTFPEFAIQENMTLVMNVPEFTYANTHMGANWEVEQSDYDEFSTAELEFHHDEANWRDQTPLYVPANDLEKSGATSGLESLTEAFCIRWTYNTTVSTTDAATTQINMTINDDTPAIIVIDGTYIYMIFTETIDFESGPYTVEFEYEEAQQIYATDVSSGRVLVPRGAQSLGAFTAYSVVGL